MTRNRLIEMMSACLSMEKDLEDFPFDTIHGPMTMTRQKVAVIHMRNQVHFIKVILQSELENK